MTLTLEKAIELWHGNGYKKIQHYLDPNYRYRAFSGNNKTVVESYKVKDIVDLLKANMKPLKKDKIYYRGSPNKGLKLLKKKTFISVSKNIEDALAFSGDQCCLYKVMVDKNVKRLKTGVENEILLENNCCLEYVDSEESININGEKHKLYSLKIYSPSSCESRSRSRSRSKSRSRNRSRNSQKAKSRSANTTNVEKSNVKIKRMLEIIPSDEYDFITSPEDIPDMPDIILTPQEKLKVFEKIQQIMKNSNSI